MEGISKTKSYPRQKVEKQICSKPFNILRMIWGVTVRKKNVYHRQCGDI